MKKFLIFTVAAAFILSGSLAYARLTSQGVSDADAWCSGPAGAEVCVDKDGNLIPTTDGDADLGTSSLEWQDGFFDGTLTVDDLTLSGTLSLPAGTISTAMLGSDSVTSIKISDGQVTTNKIGDGAITTSKLDGGSVTTHALGVPAAGPVGASLCIKAAGIIGYCSGADASACTCN